MRRKASQNKRKPERTRAHEREGDRLVRFGVSVPAQLIERFDELRASKGDKGQNRSAAIRELIRQCLDANTCEAGRGETVAVVAVVVAAGNQEVSQRLAEQRAAASAKVLSVQQLPFADGFELHSLTLKGQADSVRADSAACLAVKGVLHGNAAFVTTDRK